MPRKSLLVCGILASLVYVAADVLAAIRYPEYHSFTSRAISELMANGAPTERLVDPLFLLHGVLMIAFAVGIWMSSSRKSVHLTGALLLAYAAIGFLGPTIFEMNVRGTGHSTADVLHIALTGVLVLFILASVGVGASIRGRWFRSYSYATLLVMVVFGVVTSFAMRGVGTGEATPWVGTTERIDIGAFLLWVVVLAVSLLRAPLSEGLGATKPPGHGESPWPAVHRL
jgi:hypothetical membrane protein